LGTGHRRTIRDVCRITHHNDEAYVGALAILQAMQRSLEPEAPTATVLASIADALPDTNVRDALLALADLPRGASPNDAVNATGNSGYVAHSVPLAIFVALTAQDLPSAILTAVSCGGDTDTIASMVGQIRGGRGEELPSDWLANLPCAAEIDELCRDLDS
jgi:ADP-ribosylglycohydrolase